MSEVDSLLRRIQAAEDRIDRLERHIRRTKTEVGEEEMKTSFGMEIIRTIGKGDTNIYITTKLE